MKTIFLHIGAGKTGTSAIQSQLVLNKEQLEENNYYYPTAANDEKAKNFKITSGNAIELGRLLTCEIIEEKKIAQLVFRYIKEAKGKDILLSSEVLESYRPANAQVLKKLVNDLGYTVVIIYYVRAIADNQVSSYHQTIKRHNNSNDFSTFNKNKNIRFLKTIEKSIDIFGLENLILKNYDLVKKNIFVDFITNVLIIKDTQAFNTVNKKINRSLNKFELEFMKHINTFFTKNIESTFVSDALIHNNPDMNYKMTISKEEVDKLTLIYEEDIIKINNYLPEKERPLRLVDNLEILNDEKPLKLNPFQESVGALFAEIIKELKKS